MALTPMLQQYMDLKKQYSDCILFFRMGDFYEMFGQDALIAAPVLDIALTKRNKGTENEIPMCGVPHHSSNVYIGKLTKAGKKVAICEQISDPKLPGLVKRDVVKIITPGTTLDEKVLDGTMHNFLVSIIFKQGVYGISCCDVSTGEFSIIELKQARQVTSYVHKKNPSEIIIDEHTQQRLLEEQIDFENFFVQVLEQSIFDHDQFLKDHFHVHTFDSFGIENFAIGRLAAGFLLSYVKNTQKSAVTHLTKLVYDHQIDILVLDDSTFRNLEIFTNMQGERKGSLLEVFDSTKTKMGARRLREYMLTPLSDKQKIEERLDAVDFFYKEQALLTQVQEVLAQFADLFRIVGKIGCKAASPLDLRTLAASLELIPELKNALSKDIPKSLEKMVSEMKEHKEYIDLIEESISEDPSVSIMHGGFIQKGFHKEVDEYRSLMNSGKDFIKQMQEREIQKTGINSLKVKFNKVFGYYIEVSKTNVHAVPEHYIRKQTLVNAERYITEELKEYEQKVLSAEEKLFSLEYELYQDLLEKLNTYLLDIQKTASTIANIDVYVTYAYIALKNGYIKPTMISNSHLEITDGRHPVIELLLSQPYVPNDLAFSDSKHMMIITGPNMAGKSSYLRQNALIIYMAHLGSFVPAKKAEIPVYDRIFSRVGASDNLSKGQSTFMVEMQETANILHNCTENSFIILDELGRGTSTYDGVSIAMAVTRYLQSNTKAHVLFATHYHELIGFADQLDGISNYSIQVKENEEQGVVFLYKIIEGGTDKSYGIEVAKLAGIPQEIILDAKEHLNSFAHSQTTQQSLFDQKKEVVQVKDNTNRYYQKIVKANIESMTPLESLQFLHELQKEIQENL